MIWHLAEGKNRWMGEENSPHTWKTNVKGKKENKYALVEKGNIKLGQGPALRNSKGWNCKMFSYFLTCTGPIVLKLGFPNCLIILINYKTLKGDYRFYLSKQIKKNQDECSSVQSNI